MSVIWSCNGNIGCLKYDGFPLKGYDINAGRQRRRVVDAIDEYGDGKEG